MPAPSAPRGVGAAGHPLALGADALLDGALRAFGLDHLEVGPVLDRSRRVGREAGLGTNARSGARRSPISEEVVAEALVVGQLVEEVETSRGELGTVTETVTGCTPGRLVHASAHSGRRAGRRSRSRGSAASSAPCCRNRRRGWRGRARRQVRGCRRLRSPCAARRPPGHAAPARRAARADSTRSRPERRGPRASIISGEGDVFRDDLGRVADVIREAAHGSGFSSAACARSESPGSAARSAPAASTPCRESGGRRCRRRPRRRERCLRSGRRRPARGSACARLRAPTRGCGEASARSGRLSDVRYLRGLDEAGSSLCRRRHLSAVPDKKKTIFLYCQKKH